MNSGRAFQSEITHNEKKHFVFLFYMIFSSVLIDDLKYFVHNDHILEKTL